MVNDRTKEVIFVGLPGPTHHYGGLAPDNVASSSNKGTTSNPRQAALQALGLVQLLRDLGIPVGILPPQLRPHMPLLRQHFSGDDKSVLEQAGQKAQDLLEKASSSAAMWTANAATVTPGIDATDGRLHITTANLFTNLHRRIEADDTHRVLSAIFAEVPRCELHAPLSAAAGLCDEGDANHMRLAPSHGVRGLNVFVYGTDGSSSDPETARQTLSASQAVRQQHRLPESEVLFLRQNPSVIRAGVFHNDVIAVSNANVLLAHVAAYQHGKADIEQIAETYRELHPRKDLSVIMIEDEDLTVEEAVQTYFFNSQIVTKPDGSMALIAPLEAQTLYDGKASILMDRILANKSNPIDEVHFVDLRQSMKNGGGPACLRLRVPMTIAQYEAVCENARVIADDIMMAALTRVVEKYYVGQLTAADLYKPELYKQSRAAMAAFADVMRLPLLP